MDTDAAREIANVPKIGENDPSVGDRVQALRRELNERSLKPVDADAANDAASHQMQTLVEPSGLTMLPTDCPITKTIRAALFATVLEPTEDDVLTIVNAIKEDLPTWGVQ